MMTMWAIAGIGMAMSIFGIVSLIVWEPECAVTLFVISGLMIFLSLFYLYGTAAGALLRKDSQPSYQTISVYDTDGNSIVEYSGEMYVSVRSSYIEFIDEDGMRHVIYFSNSDTVEISEREKEENAG